MKNDKKWIGASLAVIAVAITRRILDVTGGIKSLPFIGQIIIALLCPISIYIVMKKEKCNNGNIQYKMLRLVFIFMIIISAIAIIIIVLRNKLPSIWEVNKEVFMFMIASAFGIFVLSVLIFAIRNIKNIK